MKILVTGATGFTGRYMMGFLATQKGVHPVALIRSESSALSKISGVSWVTADLLDRDRLFDTISAVCPDAIIHLAGLSRGTLEALLTINVTGTRNLLDAGIHANPDCRFLVVSSSAVYGYAGRAAIPESAPMKPLSDYGLSKMTQDTLSLMYHEIKGAAVAVARPFNLVGPNQSGLFICGRIVNQIAEINDGKKTELNLLEIQSYRDFVDVRDVVRGYFALVSYQEFSQYCAGKAFNLGSGIACSISEIISTIDTITGNHYNIRLPTSPPPIPIPAQQSDNSRITDTIGWVPMIPLKSSLIDMLDAVNKSS
jgi:GDP-4-dehydro-6-deoxy-D-mannose reductase